LTPGHTERAQHRIVGGVQRDLPRQELAEDEHGHHHEQPGEQPQGYRYQVDRTVHIARLVAKLLHGDRPAVTERVGLMLGGADRPWAQPHQGELERRH
jgi:hypothetical protein